MVDATIAALTYRRNDGLPRFVAALHQQMDAVAKDVQLVIVDNDPQASAREVLEKCLRSTDLYVHEPCPGIAAARNAALDAAKGRVLVFIDDDELPGDSWLATLLSEHERLGGEATVGPVEPDFEVPPPELVRSGRFFERESLPTGTKMPAAATHNLALDMDAVRRLGLRFDADFGIAGGSDTLFTKQLVASGGVISWCDDAVVTELIPAERTTLSWVLRRSFRVGNCDARMHMVLAGPDRRSRAVKQLARGVVRVAAGTSRAVFGVASRSPRHKARGLRTAARGAGMAGAAMGFTYREYSRKRSMQETR